MAGEAKLFQVTEAAGESFCSCDSNPRKMKMAVMGLEAKGKYRKWRRSRVRF